MSVFELLTQRPLVFSGLLGGGMVVGALIGELLAWSLQGGEPDGRIVVRRGDEVYAEIRTDRLADRLAESAREGDGAAHVTGWTDAAGQRHPLDVTCRGTPAELYFEAD